MSITEAERTHSLIINGTEGWARVDEQGPLLVSGLREAEGEGGADGPRPGGVDRAASATARTQPAGIREEPVIDDLPSSASLGIPDTDWARGFLRYARLIVNAVRDGGTVAGAATFQDGDRIQQVLDAVRESDAHGRWVKLREPECPPGRLA